MNQQNIQVLPYKGLLFLEKLYQNKPLREYNDIDIVVKPSDAPKAIQLLIKDGYVLHINIKTPNDEVTNDMLEGIPRREVGLHKANKLGFNFYIDFHWDITGSYHQYTINLDDLFNSSKSDNFQKKVFLMSSPDAIFTMLLNHHGGCSCWLILEYFCDLIAFKNTYHNYSLQELKVLANEMKMNRILENGI